MNPSLKSFLPALLTISLATLVGACGTTATPSDAADAGADTSETGADASDAGADASETAADASDAGADVFDARADADASDTGADADPPNTHCYMSRLGRQCLPVVECKPCDGGTSCGVTSYMGCTTEGQTCVAAVFDHTSCTCRNGFWSCPSPAGTSCDTLNANSTWTATLGTDAFFAEECLACDGGLVWAMEGICR